MTNKKTVVVLCLFLHILLIGTWSKLGFRLHTENLGVQSPTSAKTLPWLSGYIAITGSEQYWDFFTDTTYDSYLSLIVCDAIRFPYASQQVTCNGKILYQSHDHSVQKIITEFSGNRSRSYRFAEQLVALDDELLYERFLRYWSSRYDAPKTDSLYLIAQYFPLQPSYNQKPSNKLLWAIDLN